jgi:hypothetical protein
MVVHVLKNVLGIEIHAAKLLVVMLSNVYQVVVLVIIKSALKSLIRFLGKVVHHFQIYVQLMKTLPLAYLVHDQVPVQQQFKQSPVLPLTFMIEFVFLRHKL